MQKKASSISILGVCTALSLILSYVDSQIPLFASFPGIRLGISNLVTVYLLYKFSPAVAFSVSCVRVILSGILFFGGAVHIAYGLCGAALSILTMLLTKRIGIFSVTGVSVSGALAHNAGQIICAVLLTQTPQLVFYLPVLLIGGSVSGALIGILSAIIQKKLTAAGF